MQVRLISKTSGAVGTEYEGRSIDEIIVGKARISSSREVNELFDEPYKLLRHCLLEGHFSIFELGNLGIEITTSRAMGRELLRHTKQVGVTELSQRYKQITEIEPIELRLQSKYNRQSSTEVTNDYPLDSLIESIREVYSFLVYQGVARETARFILPEATQTTIIMNFRIREVITFLNVRLHKTAQKEIRLIAQAIKEIMLQECPIISKALYNFEYAEEIHILDRMILEKYKVFGIIKDKIKL